MGIFEISYMNFEFSPSFLRNSIKILWFFTLFFYIPWILLLIRHEMLVSQLRLLNTYIFICYNYYYLYLICMKIENISILRSSKSVNIIQDMEPIYVMYVLIIAYVKIYIGSCRANYALSMAADKYLSSVNSFRHTSYLL